MPLPQKNNSIKWKNVFALILFLFTMGLVWNAINYTDVKKYKKEYLVVKDTCSKAVEKAVKESTKNKTLYLYYQKQNTKLQDSCKRLTISYLNGTFKKYHDSTSTFWYVSYETNKLTGYDVIKLSSKSFSLLEAQSVVKQSAKIKDPFLNFVYFVQVSEKCWAEYQNSQLKK